MEPSEFASALHDFVTETSSYAHIFKLLRLLDIEDIKVFAHRQIKNMSDQLLRTAHHTILPMNQLLPCDVIQNILSFGYVHEKYAIKLVSKQWNRLYNLNEEKTLRTAYQRVMDQFLDKLPPGNITWVLDYERRQPKLLPVEQRLGLQGPLRNLEAVVQRCKSGDRVLVHEIFSSDDPVDLLQSKCKNIKKDIHFIGLFPLKYGRCWFPWVEHFNSQVILENLVMNPCPFEIGSDHEQNQCIESKLTMRNCKVLSVASRSDKDEFAIKVHSGASLDIYSCDVWSALPIYGSCWQKDERGPVAIEISPFANSLNINLCNFKKFERGILIQRLPVVGLETGTAAEINIKDTVFEDISEYAVVERTHPDVYLEGHLIKQSQKTMIKGTGRCTLSGNTSSVTLTDCNKLHHLSEHYPSEIYPDEWFAAVYDR